MKKVIAYGISILGIVIMMVGFRMSDLLGSAISPKYIVVAGIAAIIVGVFFAMDSSKKKGKKKTHHPSGDDEIPIYEGTGKDRKVVGYRKD